MVFYNKTYTILGGEVMVKDKVKKEFSLLLVLMLMAAFLTGCSDITNIALKDDGSGSYDATVTISIILWDSA